MNQIVEFGKDAIENLEIFLNEKKPQSIFLVTGKKSYTKCGAKDKLLPILKNYNFIRFYDFEENPKIEDVEKGVDIFNEYQCDLIIAVGGGSVIDIAKLVNFFNKKSKPFTSLFKSSLNKEDQHPFVAIPTTAGAGSEATHFAVVYANKLKYSIADNNLLPEMVLIDHSFLKSQSKYQMTVSGLDAFCQGIESFWCVNSNEESLEFSRKAIGYSWSNLKKAIDGEDVLGDLAKASYFAGKAINITKTTGPHSLSYGFTTNYGISHGHAVSLFLPFFINFHKNIDKENCNDSRGYLFVIKQMREIADILRVNFFDLEHEIINFFKELQIEINFNNLDINKEGFKKAIQGLNQDRLKNNPRFLSTKEIIDIYTFNSKYYIK
jgi:alcohol dehydrogenase class IV|tara:strand:- start:1317 stop:2453 length:1137 start_codon:yes stop_codon:yes gene_type:complete